MRMAIHLPPPNSEAWEWQLKGLCRDMDSRLFFHPDDERGHARMRRIRRAKQVCRRCPVMANCRDYALSAPEYYGTWGGMSEIERRRYFLRQRTGDGRGVTMMLRE